MKSKIQMFYSYSVQASLFEIIQKWVEELNLLLSVSLYS